MGFVALKEIARMEAKLDVLSDALLNYKANIDEKDCGIYKEITEKKIAEMYFQLQKLSEHFSVVKINEYLERLIKESEGGGV